jgi:FixJ family two-component response regulator
MAADGRARTIRGDWRVRGDRAPRRCAQRAADVTLPVPSSRIFYADGDLKSTDHVQAALYRIGVQLTHFDRIEDCLASLGKSGCRLLVCNLPRPEVEGLELLARIRHIAPSLPVIMLVDRGQIRTAVRAMKAGAAHCLERPPRIQELRLAVEAILDQTTVGSPPRPLTEVEAAVLRLILDGHTNREIAATLARSQRTVEVHRRHIHNKLGAEGPADLVRKAAAAGLFQP